MIVDLVVVVLDDFDVWLGSIVLLLCMLIGLYLCLFGGWIVVVDFVVLVGDFGVLVVQVCIGIICIKQKGFLLVECGDVIGYWLNLVVSGMLEWGDCWIFQMWEMIDDDLWCLVLFLILESVRSV